MKHPANKSIFAMLALSLALTACGSDKPEAPKQEPAKAAAPAEAKPEPAKAVEAKAEEPKAASEQAPKEVAPETDKGEPVKALSVAEGKTRYEQTCKVCHDQGLLDAPKLGDKAEWTKRLEKGVDTLHEHSAKGFGKMPAQAVGGVSEAEVYAAVDYMLEQAK